jgi:hypothetical protein
MVNHQTRWDSHSPKVSFDDVTKMMLAEIEYLHHVGTHNTVSLTFNG